jgi:hypothetical protein
MAAVAYIRPSTPLGFRQPHGKDLHFWANAIDRSLARERAEVWLCSGVGLTLNAFVIGLFGILARFSNAYRNPGQPPVPVHQACFVGAGLCLLMLAVAYFTKPEGRAERARQFLQNHHHSHDGVKEAGITLLMTIALYGGYCFVESFNRLRMQRRVRGVDTAELARLLAAVSNAPAGIRIADLRKVGQNETELRRALAALILTNWIKSPDGDTLIQHTRARRDCIRRHPLADVFRPGEFAEDL